jgi:glycosyltransferase involved in cell wall biosynthesis
VSALPDLTVVICTRNRSSSLRTTLECLDQVLIFKLFGLVSSDYLGVIGSFCSLFGSEADGGVVSSRKGACGYG